MSPDQVPSPTFDAPVLFQPHHRFLFVGIDDDETSWSVQRTPEDGPTRPLADLKIASGVSSHRFVVQALLAGVELRPEPEQLLPELVALLRAAAESPELILEVQEGARIRLTEDGRKALRQAASALDEQGFLPSWQPSASAPPPWQQRDEHLLIPSPGHYAALQDALARNTFERVEGSPFPRATLEKGGARGYAELRPVTPQRQAMMSPAEIDALAQRMWSQREELSDQDADTLDSISATWISQARNPSDRVGIYIDDLLRARGLTPKKGGTGRRGGFEPQQRTTLWRCLLHLQDLWLDIAEATVVEKDPQGRRRRRTRKLQSRAFVMTDRIGQQRLDGTMDVEAIMVTPGEAFGHFLLGPGRQVALLSSKALQYDPLRQRFEKRLARFLSWQWRIGAQKGEFLRTYKARTLLEEVAMETNSRQPSRTRDRLEKALDRLQADEVISAWQYHDFDESQLPRQGWTSQWLEARITIEAPEVIKNAYRNLDQLTARPAVVKAIKKPAPKPIPPNLGKRLRSKRQGLGLTQLQTAEQLGISQAYVAQIERGRNPSARVSALLQEWLDVH